MVDEYSETNSRIGVAWEPKNPTSFRRLLTLGQRVISVLNSTTTKFAIGSNTIFHPSGQGVTIEDLPSGVNVKTISQTEGVLSVKGFTPDKATYALCEFQFGLWGAGLFDVNQPIAVSFQTKDVFEPFGELILARSTWTSSNIYIKAFQRGIVRQISKYFNIDVNIFCGPTIPAESINFYGVFDCVVRLSSVAALPPHEVQRQLEDDFELLSIEL